MLKSSKEIMKNLKKEILTGFKSSLSLRFFYVSGPFQIKPLES